VILPRRDETASCDSLAVAYLLPSTEVSFFFLLYKKIFELMTFHAYFRPIKLPNYRN
jgi:hypothetical protein